MAFEKKVKNRNETCQVDEGAACVLAVSSPTGKGWVKHGDFVQIAPNHVSINNPDAIQQIYGHKTGFVKGPLYDAFHQVTFVVFNTRNVPEHTPKRNYINPAFSALGWKYQLLKISNASNQRLDFSAWSEDEYGLIKIIDTRGESMNALGSLWPFLRSAMRYNTFNSFWKNGFRASAGLAKIGKEAFERRKDSADNSRKDLLSFLFNAKDPDTKQPIPEDEIIAESISFIVGGSDTTNSTMTNVIEPKLGSSYQHSIPTLGIMMDPRIFESPEAFRPDRWLELGAKFYVLV
ncbi:benzoate 4-monooxygenase cytochrome P450 [Fusarium sp. NRRL 52700]|nr:benzoate 4-monooxygenase cytochrome P450 [Fusarium sp. NRRL 52700]